MKEAPPVVLDALTIGDHLRVEIGKVPGRTWIRPAGRIDATNWDSFADLVRGASEDDGTIYLDLVGVGSYDRDTTTSLVALWREIARAGTVLRFASSTPAVSSASPAG